MQSTGGGSVPELEAAASAALLPLVRYEADVVHLVMKHYQWAVQVDQMCYLEQQYEEMLRKMMQSEEVARVDREVEVLQSEIDDYMWAQESDFYDREKEALSRYDYGTGSIGYRPTAHVFWLSDKLSEHIKIRNDVYSRVICKFSSLKMDVAQCQRFAHPDTDRSVRKIEAGKMATRRKRLLAQIDKQIKYWDERRRINPRG
jgi:hypothetical protein